MFWPAFGWHGAELGCICPVSGWRDAGGAGALHACLLGMVRLSMLQLASRLDFHFLSGWRGESFEDQTH